MVRQLHEVYFETGRCLLAARDPERAVEMLRSSLQLSRLVASESHRLYDAYEPRELLHPFLGLMHKSKLALLQCAELGFGQA